MSLVFMAFANAKKVEEAKAFDKYLGAITAHLEAVNPSQEELNKIIGNNVSAKTYTTEVDVVDVEGNKKKGFQNAITFWYSTDGLDEQKIYFSKTVFFSNSARIGSQTGKIQIVDKWGRFAWATPEEYKGNVIPQYSNKPASISKDYRAAMVGEEELIGIIKAHLGLNAPVERLADNTYRDLTDEEISAKADDYACSIEPADIVKIAKGDVKIIKGAVIGTNDVKAVLSIRHTDKGDYQSCWKIAKLNTQITSLENEWNKNPRNNEEVLMNGHIPGNLMKYQVTPTDLSQSKGSEEAKPESDLPF